MAATPPGTLSAADLAGMSEEARARLLERNPHLADALRRPSPTAKAPKAPKPPSAPKAPAGATPRSPSSTRAPARTPALARTPARRARRAASRVARQTPGAPGPSATNLVLSFIGATVATIGLVIVVSNGERLAFLPGALGTATARLIDPADPII